MNEPWRKCLSIFLMIVLSVFLMTPTNTFAGSVTAGAVGSMAAGTAGSVTAEQAEQQTESARKSAERQRESAVETSGQQVQQTDQKEQTASSSGESKASKDQKESTAQAFTVHFAALDESDHELTGADFQLEDERGQTQKIESAASLVPGIYVVSEEKAPDGYLSLESVKFQVDADGSVLVGGEKQKDNTVTLANRREKESESVNPEETDAAESSSQDDSSKSKVLRIPAAASDASTHMHAVITTNNDTYESGTTAIVSVKYTLDQNSIHAGDYVLVTIPGDIAAKVSFSLNSQHFSGSEDLGNGQYKLTFAGDIESGLSGSFNAYVTTSTVKKTTPGTIQVGDASKTITVVPSGSPGGTGTYTDTLMKDAADNEGVSYGGYDYSDGYGDGAAQIGIADLTKGGTYQYRLYINDKKGEISNVKVKDRLPDGMTFSRDKGIEVTDRETGKAIDSALYSAEYQGQTLIFRYPGTFSNTIQINYWVDIPAGSNGSKYTNTAAITYTQDGDVHQEHRNYVLQGTANNASNGEKSVDKSVISTAADDQLVTYTIKFWNSNGFAKGEISLTDTLDSHVTFVSADPNEYFSVKQDSADPRKIHITNTEAIDGSTTTYVRFMVDMSDVPVGYTVKNTVGGNTTKTTKYDGGMTLHAVKQLNGQQSGISAGQFHFQLVSESGKVLQTKTNDADGNVSFDRISYSVNDVGKTFVYQVKEVAGNDEIYEYDPSIYTITVTPALEKDSEGNPTGKILADPVIQSGDKEMSRIVFNNTTKTGSLKLTKLSHGHDTPSDAEFTITGPDGYSKTIKYSELKEGSLTLSDLPVGTYTVKESKADVDGYTLVVDGNTTAEVVKDGTAEIKLTNTYTQNTGSLKLMKTSNGHDTPADAEFTITGPDGYSKTVKYSELKERSLTLSDLPVGTYTVKESKADVDGYTLVVDGSETAEVVKGGIAEIKLINTYTNVRGATKPSDNSHKKTEVPRTGDHSNPTAWFILLAGSCAWIIGLLAQRRSSSSRKKQR